MFALKLVEPRQQQVSTEIRRRRQLQDPTDLILTASQQPAPLVEIAQRRPGVFEKPLALGGQAQAACGTGKQTGAELLFDTLQRRAGHCSGQVHPARRRGQTAQVRGPDEQLQIIETQHFQPRLSKKY
ncbi:hypothetical protein J2W17_005222 [Pseudomonas lini]|nr:hypothetical protein [Pseudomonas lini]